MPTCVVVDPAQIDVARAVASSWIAPVRSPVAIVSVSKKRLVDDVEAELLESGAQDRGQAVHARARSSPGPAGP